MEPSTAGTSVSSSSNPLQSGSSQCDSQDFLGESVADSCRMYSTACGPRLGLLATGKHVLELKENRSSVPRSGGSVSGRRRRLIKNTNIRCVHFTV